MKYAINKVINGNYFIHAEGINNIENAITQFHGVCQTLWNAPDVSNACVMIVDEQLYQVGHYREEIRHVTNYENN